MFKKYICFITMALMATVTIAAQGTFQPRDADEEHAWRLHNDYRRSRTNEDDLKRLIAMKASDINTMAVGVIPLWIDPQDVKDKTKLRSLLQNEISKQTALKAAWDKKFYGRYGNLQDADETIVDKGTGRTMDKIEFRLINFPFNVQAQGYWKYDSESFRPTNEYYATVKPLPGHVYEVRVAGGLQGGSIEQFFKTDNADRVVHLTTSTLTFGANTDLVTLVPLQKVVFQLGLAFSANEVVRANGPQWGYGTGSIAIDNGDNIFSVGTQPGATASGKGEGTIPGGGPDSTMVIHVNSGLSQLGAMHTTLDIVYVWVAGTPPKPKSGSPNLALNQPAKQSSTSRWSQPNDAKGAVDGVKNGSFGFHTAEEPNPWWQVDLGAAKPITEVRVFNRLDYNPERARTLQVFVSNDGKNWTRLFANDGTIFGGADGHPLKIMFKGTTARFVRLQLAETTYFHLDEVEIY
jgi:hypothetical protein